MMARNLRQDLVVLRTLRENRTVLALGRLHRECTEANVHLQREQRQLDGWRCQASDEEAALYAALLAEPVNRKELERTFARIDTLRQRTRALERAVAAAREKRDQAQTALDQGRLVRAAAARATRKSVEVLDIHRRQCALTEERSADDALDETAVMLHGRIAI
ncbi:hypothetical protein AKI39_19320 [Bordetella sp. H567]|uniref:type III secretion system stalk subunit SctO n=1 Tax=Bordetella sp. H567 TaxID=1697043 RepID=UPI00081C67D5|nr:YscO family type III secretion system apparatus protein [Bordetella sp. H567]AOB32411.1 hypothetical protein AKI39_19320 [Bordetella sp. H567]